jgi:membrane associated rhomboid family serine protease
VTDLPELAASTALPTCYRHPDRETGVRCTRCDRPICPDCMNSASVGFQCPECVREGRATTRQARTAFGGMVPAQVGQVTRLLIAINVVVFIIQQTSNTFTEKYALISDAFVPQISLAHRVGVAHGEYYRLLTSAFMHQNVLHIAFNMYALLVVGPIVEHALGRLRFVVLYLLAALGGSAVAYVFASPTSETLGASGAIFGLFAALFVVARRLGTDASGIVATIAINLVITFTLPNISWEGHLGGLVTGGFLAAAYGYAPRGARTQVQVASSLVVVGAIVLAVALRTSALTG